MAKATPTMEDYIEVIYSLVKNKGYARSADIAEKLDVYPSTVTKMLKKLDVEGYIVYEKYRGIALTEQGEKMGEYALTRHELLEDFLRLIGVDEDKVGEADVVTEVGTEVEISGVWVVVATGLERDVVIDVEAPGEVVGSELFFNMRSSFCFWGWGIGSIFFLWLDKIR